MGIRGSAVSVATDAVGSNRTGTFMSVPEKEKKKKAGDGCVSSLGCAVHSLVSLPVLVPWHRHCTARV